MKKAIFNILPPHLIGITSSILGFYGPTKADVFSIHSYLSDTWIKTSFEGHETIQSMKMSNNGSIRVGQSNLSLLGYILRSQLNLHHSWMILVGILLKT